MLSAVDNKLYFKLLKFSKAVKYYLPFKTYAIIRYNSQGLEIATAIYIK